MFPRQRVRDRPGGDSAARAGDVRQVRHRDRRHVGKAQAGGRAVRGDAADIGRLCEFWDYFFLLISICSKQHTIIQKKI